MTKIMPKWCFYHSFLQFYNTRTSSMLRQSVESLIPLFHTNYFTWMSIHPGIVTNIYLMISTIVPLYYYRIIIFSGWDVNNSAFKKLLSITHFWSPSCNNRTTTSKCITGNKREA